MSWSGDDTPPGGFPAVGRDEPEIPTKVCPKCSIQERTAGGFCPHCGTSYERRRGRRLSKRTKTVLAVIIGVLVAGGATGGVIAKLSHDDKIAKREAAQRAAERKRREQAALDRRFAQIDADTKRRREEAERASRRDLVRSLQRSVTKNARKNVDTGVLDGPILRTECNPSGTLDIDDLTVDSADYECLAATKENNDGTLSGYRFSATVNFATGSYTWHLGG